MKKHVLLVRSGYPFKEFTLQILKDEGYYVIVLDSEKHCPDKYVDEWIIADTTNPQKCVKAVNKYLSKKGKRLDGVVTFWEEAVVTTTAIAESLKLPGNPLEKVRIIKNKYKFREFCEKNNLPTPQHHHLCSESDFETIQQKLNFPVVVKPVFGAASAFVIKVNDIAELKEAYHSIRKSIKDYWLADEWESVDLYVEDYIEGEEVDIDILLQDGVCKFYSISDNYQTHEPYFIETGQAVPSRLPVGQKKELIDMALLVLDKAGIKNGAIHFEAKMSPKGPVPIEVNLRMGGDEVYSFVKEAWGVDMVKGATTIAVGGNLKVSKPKEPLKHLEGRYFLSKQKGVLKKIRINESILKDPNLYELHLSKQIGESIDIPPVDYDYFGWITTHGKSPLEAKIALERMFEQIAFILETYEQPQIPMHF